MSDGCSVSCPYCGEPTWIPYDRDGGTTQRFVSDCEVCCRPMELRVTVAPDGSASVAVSTDGA